MTLCVGEKLSPIPQTMARKRIKSIGTSQFPLDDNFWSEEEMLSLEDLRIFELTLALTLNYIEHHLVKQLRILKILKTKLRNG